MASIDDFPSDGFNLEEVSDGLFSMIEVADEMFCKFRDPYLASKWTEVTGDGMVQISHRLLNLEEAIASMFSRGDLIRLSRNRLNNCEPERRPLIERFIEYLKAKERDDKCSVWAQQHINWINRVMAERSHAPVAIAVSALLNNPYYSNHLTTKTTYYLSWHEAAFEIGITLLSEYYLYLGGSRYRSENKLDDDKLKHWLYCWFETNWEEVLAGLRQERIILEAALSVGIDVTSQGKPADEYEMTTGVSLRDIAFVIEGDDIAATDTVRRWSKSGKIKAKSIGKCPVDARAQLYRLFEILDDVKKILSLTNPEVEKYRKVLKAKQRLPK